MKICNIWYNIVEVVVSILGIILCLVVEVLRRCVIGAVGVLIGVLIFSILF